MPIDGITNTAAARRGRQKDQRQFELLKKRKQARDQVEDKKFQIELEKALGFKLDKLILD